MNHRIAQDHRITRHSLLESHGDAFPACRRLRVAYTASQDARCPAALPTRPLSLKALGVGSVYAADML